MFLDWFNAKKNADWVTKAALAHLWFVTIHPFDDGNGRVARAIADMALARSEHRFYSMSSQIRTERNDYYRILERTEKGTTDITDWMIGLHGPSQRQKPPSKRPHPSSIWRNVQAVNSRRTERSPGRLLETHHLQVGQTRQMDTALSPTSSGSHPWFWNATRLQQQQSP